MKECFTHSDLLQEPHEAGGGHHADLPHQRPGDGSPPLILPAAARIRLQGAKICGHPFRQSELSNVFPSRLGWEASYQRLVHSYFIHIFSSLVIGL